MVRHLCVLLLGLALFPGVAAAQWSVELEPMVEGQPDRRVAVGRNRQGDSLRIGLGGDELVQAVFSLRPGLSALASGCPSYRVDDKDPRALVVNGGLCRAEGRSVIFSLGHVIDGSIDSESLLELMNGSRIRFIYHLHGAGYDQATFSLSGSKQAINDVLDGVTVNDSSN